MTAVDGSEMCFMCFQTFPNHQLFATHYQEQHINWATFFAINKFGLPTDPPYFCSICKKFVGELASYESHFIHYHWNALKEVRTYLLKMLKKPESLSHPKYKVRILHNRGTPRPGINPLIVDTSPTQPPILLTRQQQKGPSKGPWNIVGWKWDPPLYVLDKNETMKVLCAYGCGGLLADERNVKIHYRRKVKRNKMIVHNGKIRCIP